MSSSSRSSGPGSIIQAHVERWDGGGMSIASSRGRSTFIPWQLLGLSGAPDSSAFKTTLRWRLNCVDPESGPRDFFAGDHNNWRLAATHSRPLALRPASIRTGVLSVELNIEKGAFIYLAAASMDQRVPRALCLTESFSVCLEHRQPWDKGTCCLCGRGPVSVLQERRNRDNSQSAASYAARWGAMVELEAAASAIESNDSRFLCQVYIRWEPTSVDGVRRGSFDISVGLARSHKLKFRGLLGQGGERASGWLCMRDACMLSEQKMPWSGHAHIVAAGILGEGEQLGLDDEDNLKSMDGRRSITVVFEVLNESSDPGAPCSSCMTVEYIPKSLSHSMQHTALAEINPLPAKDGSPAKPLLARDVALNLVPPCNGIDSADISQWNLNTSQDKAVRRALARPLMLVHGPPGTGKTRTAAILMTLLAKKNLGSRCAMLFAAPTNKACDAALHNTDRLCRGHFAERLRARVEDDGEAECAICLDTDPDIVTACGHVFHRACLARSLQESSKCPLCRQILKQNAGGLRILRVYGADSEREDFPVPKKIDHKGVQSFKPQTVPVEMRRFTLHWRCHAAVEGEEPSAEALKARAAYDRLRSTSTRANNFDERRAEYYERLTKAREIEIHQSDIIFTTCVSARRMVLVGALASPDAPEVRQVILDEAGQAPEPEALCPLAVAKKAQQAIFFGDHNQLRPILRSQTAERAGLGISLFERLATQDWGNTMEQPVALLAEQYRMHPDISCFPRLHFYNGKVLDDSSVLRREVGLLLHPTDRTHAACLLWDSAGDGSGAQEQLQQVRTVGAGGVGSRSNPQEASRAAALAISLAKQAGEKAVAVLSWYNSQVAKVSDILSRSGCRGVHVGSIATAQGSEWDYVILSAVRTGHGGSLGLVADPHNLNVALTRAKLGLVILCDSDAVRRDAQWNALLKMYKMNGRLVFQQPGVQIRRSTFAPQSCLPPPPPAPAPAPQSYLAPPPPAERAQHNLLEASVFQNRCGTAVPQAAKSNHEMTKAVLNDNDIPMQAAELMTFQIQSQLRQCPCGNFANPLLNGSCNACNAEHQRKLWQYVLPASRVAALTESINDPCSFQLSDRAPLPPATNTVCNAPVPPVTKTGCSSHVNLGDEIGITSGAEQLSKFMGDDRHGYPISTGHSLEMQFRSESSKPGIKQEAHDKSSDESTTTKLSHQRSSSEESPSSQSSNFKRRSGHGSSRERYNSPAYRKRPRRVSASISRSSSFHCDQSMIDAADRLNHRDGRPQTPGANSSGSSSASAEKVQQKRGPRNALFCG